jgi:hypothetical protein
MSFIEQLRERATLRQKHAHHMSNLRAMQGLGFRPEHPHFQEHMAGLEEVEQKLVPMPRIYDPRG